MKAAIIVLGLAIAGAAGWFFVSPLFIDKTVDERFDFALADGSFNMEAVMTMTQAERDEMKSDIMAAAAAAPDKPLSEPMSTGSPRVIARGSFVDADAIHEGSGDATLYELPDGSHLVRFENFRTTNGPALVVYLAKHPAPTSAQDVIDGGFLELGKLKGNVGNQNYAIPESANLDEYRSVVIWCELFDVLFSPAALAAVSA